MMAQDNAAIYLMQKVIQASNIWLKGLILDKP